MQFGLHDPARRIGEGVRGYLRGARGVNGCGVVSKEPNVWDTRKWRHAGNMGYSFRQGSFPGAEKDGMDQKKRDEIGRSVVLLICSEGGGCVGRNKRGRHHFTWPGRVKCIGW